MARVKLTSKLAILAAFCLGLSALTIQETNHYGTGSYYGICMGIGCIVSSCMSCILLRLWTLPVSPNDGIILHFLHLYHSSNCYLRGRYRLHQAVRNWKNPVACQERYLLRVLKENCNTEYGRRYHLEDIISREAFRKRHPLITYEEYKAFVERVMNGETNILSPKPMTSFVKTSGTTGSSKFIGHTNRPALLRYTFLDVLYALAFDLCPDLSIVQKQFYHYVCPVVNHARNGGRLESAMTLMPDWRLYDLVTPKAGYLLKSFDSATYIHLLFALRDPNIGIFYCAFMSNIETMIKLLEHSAWWEDIVEDIQAGTINDRIKMPEDIRESLVKELGGGDRDRAGYLRVQFQKGFDGIMKRVWPKLGVIISTDNTGIWPSIKDTYAKGVPLNGMGYGCSETMLVAIYPWSWEQRRDMVFMNDAVFLEFIKLEDSHLSQPRTYFLDEVVVGEEYEVVFTQASGLYRYRVGDVIRFTGYHHNSPTFVFSYRLGLMLNLRAEKMNQWAIREGLDAAVAQWSGVKLIEYSAAESRLIPDSSLAFERDEVFPYYVLFLELEFQDEEDIENAKRNIDLIDRELCDRNIDYKRMRLEGTASHPRVHFVKPSTFENLKYFVLANPDTTANQYKVPRKLRTPENLEFMLHHAI